MKKKLFLLLLVCLLVSTVAQAAFKPILPTVLDPSYGIRILVAPSNLGHGTNGCNFDAGDNFYVGSVSGVATYQVDTDTGSASIFVGEPNGGADDLFFTKDGKMYWTAFFLGKTLVRQADGKISQLAGNLPGANAITMNKAGSLYHNVSWEMRSGRLIFPENRTTGKSLKRLAVLTALCLGRMAICMYRFGLQDRS